MSTLRAGAKYKSSVIIVPGMVFNAQKIPKK